MVRNCSLCKQPGHNRATCALNATKTSAAPLSSCPSALVNVFQNAPPLSSVTQLPASRSSTVSVQFQSSGRGNTTSQGFRLSPMANSFIPNSNLSFTQLSVASMVPNSQLQGATEETNGSLDENEMEYVAAVTNFNSENDGNRDDNNYELNAAMLICPPLPDCFPSFMPDNFSIPSAELASTTSFRWGIHGRDFVIAAICEAYEEITSFRKNVFDVPKTASGNKFIDELTKLFYSALPGNALELVAMKAVAIFFHLVLQKSTPHDKARENKANLTRRLALWFDGDFRLLLDEALIIQSRLIQYNTGLKPAILQKKIHEKILMGDMKGAIKLVETQSQSGGVLPLTQDVLYRLKELHPEAIAPLDDLLILGPVPDVLSVTFEPINAYLIRRCAIRSTGSAGVSGADSAMWKQLLCAHAAHSDMLCEALAAHARSLCQHIHDPRCLEAFLANRLVPLDKNPGVRPVGIGEMVRRIYGKAFTAVFRDDVIKVTGATQLCCGQEAGIEAIIHAMRDIFEDDSCEGVLLIDADNAFNRVNRYTLLHNVQYSCPPMAKVLNNFYRHTIRLFVSGGAEILSKEGTTQGCPLAMQMYALAIMPLINACRQLVREPTEPPDPSTAFTQAWYADDAQAAGSLLRLRDFLQILVEQGPAVGYFVKVSKTVLVVKEGLEEAARRTFEGTGIEIQSRGVRDLGSAIGTKAFVSSYMVHKAQHWTSMVEYLANFARSYPQSSYSLFVHSMRHKLSYIERTTEGVGCCLQLVEDAICNDFIPALFGTTVLPTELERKMYSLPIKLGGLSIDNPVTGATHKHMESKTLCLSLSNLIKTSEPAYTIDKAEQHHLKSELKKVKKARVQAEAESVRSQLDLSAQRSMDIAQEKGASVVFTLVPVAKFGYGLHNKREFTDALCVRYNKPLPNFPLVCACGRPNSTVHAQSCLRGGFVHQRHDQVRDLLAKFCGEVMRDVEIEPRLAPITGEVLQPGANLTDGARSDIRVRGIMRNAQDTFIDTRITTLNGVSAQNKSFASIYATHEKEKNVEYQDRIEQVDKGNFVPFVMSASGGLGPAANEFLQRLAERVAIKRREPYSKIIGLLRNELSYCLARAMITSLRASRTKRTHGYVLEHPTDIVQWESRGHLLQDE